MKNTLQISLLQLISYWVCSKRQGLWYVLAVRDEQDMDSWVSLLPTQDCQKIGCNPTSNISRAQVREQIEAHKVEV